MVVKNNYSNEKSQFEQKDDVVEIKGKKSGLNETHEFEVECDRTDIWNQFEKGKTLEWHISLEKIDNVKIIAESEEDNLGRTRILVHDKYIDEYVYLTEVTKQQKAEENGYDVESRGSDINIVSADVYEVYYELDEDELEERLKNWGVDNFKYVYINSEAKLECDSESETWIASFELVD